MRLISILLRLSPRSVVLAIFAGVVSGAANAALLAVINTAITRSGPADPRLGLAFAALVVLVPVTGVSASYVMSALGQRAVLDLRVTLARQILSAPLRTLETVGAHRLLSVLTTDLGSLVSALVRLPTVFTNLAIVTGCLLYLGWLSGLALAVSVLLLALAIVTYRQITRHGMRYYRTAREETDRLWKHFRAATEGMKEIKLHAQRKEAFMDGLRSTGERARHLNLVAATIYTAAAGWGHLVVFVAIGTVVFLVPEVHAVDLRTLTGYTLILLYMVGPLTSLMETIPALSQAHVAFAHVNKLGITLDGNSLAHASCRPLPRPATLPAEWSRLELDGVTHSYTREGEEHNFTLGPIDMDLRPGEIVFLVGGNGSGKTTLAKLILGLYAPEEGQVRLDGVPVTDGTREAYLQHFSVVFSEFYLFDSFLGINTPRLDDRAGEYLAQLQLSSRVKVENGRLSTLDLSQGQRKRLALLTAYLEDRPIYLFDEWAADQDPMFKEVFYCRLLPDLKARGKTVIVISHDDRYYKFADRVLKLDAGRLEYDGPPAAAAHFWAESAIIPSGVHGHA